MAKRGGIFGLCGFSKRQLILGFVILWVSVMFLAPHIPGNFSSSVIQSLDRSTAQLTLGKDFVADRNQESASNSSKDVKTPVEDSIALKTADSLLEAESGSAVETAVHKSIELERDSLKGSLSKDSVVPEENKDSVAPEKIPDSVVPEETEERGRVRARLLSARQFNGDRPKGDADLWDSTIFVGMAAYRDPDCQDCVWSALSMAANPERVSIGIYQQHHATEDPDCLAFQHVICPPQNRSAMQYASQEERANRPWFRASPEEIAQVCTGLQRVSITRVDFLEGKGPTVARYHTQTLLGNQQFFLQVDSHSHFIWGWDVEIMRNWKATGNAKAVISGTYPVPHSRMPEWMKRPHPQVPKGDDVVKVLSTFDTTEAVEYRQIEETDMSPAGPLPRLEGFEIDYVPDIVAIICQIKYVHDASDMPRCESAQFIKNPGHPVKVPFWTAGIAFSTAQAVRDVPYDPYTPYLFDGEEFSTAARLWTWGYDVYAPFTDIVFHVYESRYKRNKYWEIDWGERYRIQQISARRIRYILGMPLPDDAEFDRTELDRFGLGKVRPLQEFLDMAGIDLVDMTSFHICKEVEEGRFPDPKRELPRAQFVDPAQPLKHSKPPSPPGQEDDSTKEAEEDLGNDQQVGQQGVAEKEGLLDPQVQAVDPRRGAQVGADRLAVEGEGVRQQGEGIKDPVLPAR